MKSASPRRIDMNVPRPDAQFEFVPPPSIGEMVKRFLEHRLKDGPCPTKTLFDEALGLGYRRATIVRAAHDLGIISEWWARLPEKKKAGREK